MVGVKMCQASHCRNAGRPQPLRGPSAVGRMDPVPPTLVLAGPGHVTVAIVTLRTCVGGRPASGDPEPGSSSRLRSPKGTDMKTVCRHASARKLHETGTLQRNRERHDDEEQKSRHVQQACKHDRALQDPPGNEGLIQPSAGVIVKHEQPRSQLFLAAASRWKC